MNIQGKHIVIVGLGKSGISAARFLSRRHARVTVTDMAGEKALKEKLEQLKGLDIRQELGGHQVKTFETADLIVLSPGVPHTIEPVNRARKKGVPVIGEIELASRFIGEPIVAVTGTNGKTTTTTMVGEMLRCSGKKVFVGGNIGNPLIGYVDGDEKADIVVVELSSFQLDTIDTFRPSVAVLLNIAEDHMDRYPDFGGYIRSKARIFENQHPDDQAVLNGSDASVRAIAGSIRSRRLWFNGCPESEYGVVMDGGHMLFRMGPERTCRIRISCAEHLGRHNLENVAAASLASLAAGATPEGIETAMSRFESLPHRLESVAVINGVEYVNDSKATNVAAVAKALESLEKPVVLIMGGRNKGSDFSLLEPLIKARVKQLVVMGEAREDILNAIGKAVPSLSASSMSDALRLASDCASSGDAVVLSPACSSFDMFDSYGHRGNIFRKAVEALRCKSQ
ncbi:MAG: UDP-N-acetylmuramoyl-L-alanine--D-glutamate ligase [Desulfobacterales bacterium]|nr:UDP-N-acetylmuramoyl-L-alanine--D-glutamate ligase [Desulfobacterales bacterium]MDD4071310.1 UDP-N-acetylmuramoyl-L-alanine--D-glutamate ligase [Desulfobacterales bacterium]MDD4393006.1 UDP-N-acetylmuramoyl-L-alanine--D-glutamate ligase [Desulfobacterales bacterium]